MQVDYSGYPGLMRTITVAELRQNPTAALDDVAHGETLVVTKHRRPVAKLVPPDDDALLRVVPARDTRPSRLSDRPPADQDTVEETEKLLAEMASDW